MEKIEIKKQELETQLLPLRERVMRSAMAVNNCLTKEYLSTFDFCAMCAFVHPIERQDFLKEYYEIVKKISRSNSTD